MYQPMWRDGQTMGDARRDAVTRYEAIAGRLGHLPPGFRAVDVGAHSGYFSYRMADELGADVLAIDGDPALRDGVAQQGHHERVHASYANLLPGQLPGLGNFDVGLCLSVLHHLHWWPRMIEDLLDACALVFIETAVPGESLSTISARTGPTCEAVEALPGAEVICKVPGFDARFPRPTYVIPGRGAGTLGRPRA